METIICSHVLEPSTLTEAHSDNLCANYMAGYCKKGDRCEASHAICAIYKPPPPPWASQPVQSDLNYLFLVPRIPRPAHLLFDSDGPGYLCKSGKPRHDNDHVDFRNIQILPTTDEILCLRPPYMPRKDAHPSHFHEAGQARLLDTLFRQVRYESVEAIINISHYSSQILAAMTRENPSIAQSREANPRMETPRGDGFTLFRNVEFEEHVFHRTQGLVMRVSYDCPVPLRGGKIHRADVLKDGMLVSLVGLDNESKQLSVTFFEVHLRESTDAMKGRGGAGTRASIQLSFAQRDNSDDVRRMLLYSQSILKGSFVLVEYPKVLLPGFYHCLKQLQYLLHRHELPFLDHIASPEPGTIQKIEPPEYAKAKGFNFDLTCLKSPEQSTGQSKLLMPGKGVLKCREDFTNLLVTLQKETTLDTGQAVALVENLCRGLAFTQGPPGTGKTYLGVSLVKAIYASHMAASTDRPKPILAVCMTNHALDSFLGDLRKEGIQRIARLGSQSKEPWTKALSLLELSRQMKRTQLERGKDRHKMVAAEALLLEGVAWCEALNGRVSVPWRSIREHLAKQYKVIYEQFAVLDTTTKQKAETRQARYAGGFAFSCWAEGHDLNALRKLSKEFSSYLGIDLGPAEEIDPSKPTARVQQWLDEIIASAREVSEPLMNANVWGMSPRERQSLMEKWRSEIGPRTVLEKTAEVHRRHHVARDALMAARHEVDIRCLEEQQVIGVTTTACAKYWPLLNELGITVVICEEAGEVMEAHTMCTLFPSTQHAIFIGDPLQLRPQVNEQALALESDVGSHYRLDESLFERLVSPKAPDVKPVPFSQLTLQRRMHPEIADISRTTLYDYLLDHESTELHEEVPGLVHRMFWFDHKTPEDAPDQTTKSKTLSNRFEMDMVVGMVQYLIGRNEYDLGQIAVLTPYNGQLSLLCKRLSAVCSIYLSEKDRTALVDDNNLSIEEDVSGSRSQVSMLNMLRVATVDNFQGEEAKVVILSTVRSNPEGRVGFLRTVNRINVACSRARDGFYVIGNSSTMRNVPMWGRIIDLFISKNRIGPFLQVCCSRHRFQVEQVFEPAKFRTLRACQMVCHETLPCGHQCYQICHAPSLHERQKCTKPCKKVHAKCEHQCYRTCGQPCGPCEVVLKHFTLACGHEVPVLCGQQEYTSTLECTQVVDVVQLDCGHAVEVICSKKDNTKSVCEEPCSATLTCGHKCGQPCSTCFGSESHPTCQSKCGKEQGCGHLCLKQCHKGVCPPCQQPCRLECEHGPCKMQCFAICDPCVKRCHRSCQHQGTCQVMCSLPCSVLPCSQPCSRIVGCGHACPSLCGERCPDKCSLCRDGSVSEKPLMVLHCGHFFDVDVLDGHVEIERLFSLDGKGNPVGFKESISQLASTITSLQADSVASLNVEPQCPTCQAPIKDVFRYSRFQTLPDLHRVIDRMHAKFGRKLLQKHQLMAKGSHALMATFPSFSKKLVPNVMASRGNQGLVRQRGCWFDDFTSEIMQLKDLVLIPFQRDLGLTLAFPLRLELLAYRCQAHVFRDTLRVRKHMLTLKDDSKHLQALTDALYEALQNRVRKTLELLAEDVAKAATGNFACLEVELLLARIEVCAIAHQVKADAEGFEPMFARIEELRATFPETAGRFSFHAETHRLHVSARTVIPPVLGKEETRHWDQWGKYKTGYLTKCPLDHLYSSATFTCCPECGPKHQPQPPGTVDFVPFLAGAEAFLKAVLNPLAAFKPEQYGPKKKAEEGEGSGKGREKKKGEKQGEGSSNGKENKKGSEGSKNGGESSKKGGARTKNSSESSKTNGEGSRTGGETSETKGNGSSNASKGSETKGYGSSNGTGQVDRPRRVQRAAQEVRPSAHSGDTKGTWKP